MSPRDIKVRCIEAFSTTTLEKLTGEAWEGFASSGLVNRVGVRCLWAALKKHTVQVGLYSPKIENGASWEPRKHRWFREALPPPAFRFYL